jgi:hypothetical protein
MNTINIKYLSAAVMLFLISAIRVIRGKKNNYGKNYY